MPKRPTSVLFHITTLIDIRAGELGEILTATQAKSLGALIYQF